MKHSKNDKVDFRQLNEGGKRKGAGRPVGSTRVDPSNLKKPADYPRITIRLLPKEFDRITAKSKLERMSLPEWVRHVLSKN